jgi:hypothetical protein
LQKNPPDLFTRRFHRFEYFNIFKPGHPDPRIQDENADPFVSSAAEHCPLKGEKLPRSYFRLSVKSSHLLPFPAGFYKHFHNLIVTKSSVLNFKKIRNSDFLQI